LAGSGGGFGPSFSIFVVATEGGRWEISARLFLPAVPGADADEDMAFPSGLLGALVVAFTAGALWALLKMNEFGGITT